MKPDALVFMIVVFGVCLGGFLLCLFAAEKKRP
jgi:hypothetical protein